MSTRHLFRAIICGLTLVPMVSPAEQIKSTTTLPAYAESAFPVDIRTTLKKNFLERLEAARIQAKDTDIKLTETFGSLPDDTIQKIRITKRQVLRDHLFSFIQQNLSRNDATGLGFAELGLADLAIFEKYFDNEIKHWKNFPRPENNPVIFNVQDFGAKGDGTGDDRPAFMKAFDAIRALNGKPSILRVPAGVYRFASSQPEPCYTIKNRGEVAPATNWASCLVSRIENCVIQGDGAEKTQILNAVYDRTAVNLSFCTNVTLKGFEVRFEKQPQIQGKVIAFDFNTGVLELELVPGSLRPDDPCMKDGVNTSSLQYGAGYLANGTRDLATRLIPFQLPINGAPGTQYEYLSENKLRLFLTRNIEPWAYDNCVKNIKIGQTVVITHRRNGCEAVAIEHSNYCTAEDIWVRNSRATSFVSNRSEYTSLNRCRISPVNGFAMASCADGFFCEPGSFVYQCDFDSMGDDGLNSHSYGELVQKSNDPLKFARLGLNNLKGELLSFANFHTGQYLGNRTVAENDKIQPGFLRKLTSVTKPIETSFYGSICYNSRRYGTGTVICNSTVRNGRLCGYVLESPNVLIENCQIINTLEGVRLSALGDCKEGPPPYNVLVKDCKFQGMTDGFTCWIRMLAEKGGWSEIQCAPIRGVECINNTFFAIKGNAVKIRFTGDAFFAGNKFKNVAKKYFFDTCEDITCNK